MVNKSKGLLLISLFLLQNFVAIPIYALDIIYPPVRHGSELDKYALRLAKFLLKDSTETISFIPYKEMIHSQKRQVILLREGEISLTWLGADSWVEEQVSPIPFPIFRGLLGHRIFITNKESAVKLSTVNTVNELRSFSMVQGYNWADNKILKHAKFNVKAVSDFDSTFKLVNAGRIDLYPRSVFEPYSELAVRSKLSTLEVDDRLMLVYKHPMLFFLSPTKNHQKIVSMFQDNFLRAYKDGTFIEFFNNDPLIKQTFAQVKLNQRKTIHLDNPFLSDLSKKISPQYWLDSKSID